MAFREYLSTYTGSNGFRAIVEDTQRLKADLLQVHIASSVEWNPPVAEPPSTGDRAVRQASSPSALQAQERKAQERV